MNVHYEFAKDQATGARNFSDVEVSEELGAVLAEPDREEYNNNQTETRRHESLNYKNDKWEALVDRAVNIENDIIANIDYEKLYNAIEQLLPQQQELVKKYFFKDLQLQKLQEKKMLTTRQYEGVLRKFIKG